MINIVYECSVWLIQRLRVVRNNKISLIQVTHFDQNKLTCFICYVSEKIIRDRVQTYYWQNIIC